MSASASLLTGKNRRRALQALIAAPLLALGIAAGSGTAHASTPSSTFIPEEIHLPDGHCSISGWPNGEIFCNTDHGANFPDGTQEIFAIGLNDAVWTDWGTEAKPSGWKSMGGPTTGGCNPGDGIGLSNFGNYSLSVYCQDNNSGTLWWDSRSAGVSGGWAGWLEYIGPPL